MLVALLAFGGAVVGLLITPDFMPTLACSAAENLPCRPLTLECLFAGAGGLAAGLPAIPPGWGGFPPVGGPPPGDAPTGDTTPEQQPAREDPLRQYAPDPPPGYQPPPPRSPQDALSDPEFSKLKDDWARENAGRLPTVREDGGQGMTAADVLVQSIRHSGERR